MRSVFINSLAAALPNDPVSNDDMESRLGIAGTKASRARRMVLKNNGISSRYYAIDAITGEATHSNAQLTAEAVENLQIPQTGIDCLVCGTSIPDQLLPNHAVMVQGELKLPACEVVATSGVCLAGMSALKYAWMAVASGQHENAVATGSEVASAILRGHLFTPEVDSKVDALAKRPELAFEKDFLRWMLSDGAGAVYLQAAPGSHGLSLRIDWIEIRSFADSESACMYAGAEKLENGRLKGWLDFQPQEWLTQSVFSIKQDIKLLNDRIVPLTVEEFLPDIISRRQLRLKDVDYFLPHYSSEYFRQRLYDGMRNSDFEIPFDKWWTNLDTRGNTGAASIYIMLSELFHSGDLQQGQTLLCFVPESGRFSSAFMQLTVCDANG